MGNKEENMELSTFIYFITSSVLLTLMPGPDIIFVITASITQGRKSGIFTSLGLCTGLLFHTTIAALGISLLIQSSPLAFSILKYAGAAYLFYLAWISFKERNEAISGAELENMNMKKYYIRGIFMNILNPKVSIFFLAFLPQFVPQGVKNTSLFMIFLGAVFIIQAISVFTTVSVISGFIGENLLKSEKFPKIMAYVKITVYTILALNLIFEFI
jgi:threonine/homoserine/homoserine lactone efflux protein